MCECGKKGKDKGTVRKVCSSSLSKNQYAMQCSLEDFENCLQVNICEIRSPIYILIHQMLKHEAVKDVEFIPL